MSRFLRERIADALGARGADYLVDGDDGELVLSWRESRVDENEIVKARDRLEMAGLAVTAFGAELIVRTT